MPSERVLERENGTVSAPDSAEAVAGVCAVDNGTSSLLMTWFFCFFLVSGFCGLLYEMVWLRLAMASFGVTSAMISIVLSVFMGGLGLGSLCAALFVKHFARKHANVYLRLYACVELVIGLSAIAVPYQLKLGRVLLQLMATSAAWQSSCYYLLAGLWIAITLLPWCSCMGATFPLLMSVIERVRNAHSKRSFSYLYVANLLGALLGTIISVVFLIELLGFRKTLYVAGTLNLILGICAFFLSSMKFSIAEPTADKSPVEIRNAIHGIPNQAIPVVVFITGFVSMGMEVIWIRQFSPYLGNVVYAFAGILAVYLFASFWGSQDYRSWILTHDADACSFSWPLVALAAVLPLAAADPLAPIRIGSLELGGVRLSSIVLFCALTGFLTPLLLDSFSAGNPERAGKAYAMNVLGCLVGPVVAGFWLLPWLGERRSLVALAIPLFGLCALVALRDLSGRSRMVHAGSKTWIKYGLVILAIGGIIGTTHDYEQRYPGAWVHRDNSATVIARGRGWDRELVVNGRSMTRLNPITKYIAHLPLALMEKPPRNALVICFGMGTTYRSMLSWGIPQRL